MMLKAYWNREGRERARRFPVCLCGLRASARTGFARYFMNADTNACTGIASSFARSANKAMSWSALEVP